MPAIDVKNRKYLVQKVIIQGDSIPGSDGPAGAPGAPGASITSLITHDGVERNSEKVDILLDELLYLAIALTSFTNQHGNQEKGVTIANVGLDWTRNKLSTTQTLTGSGISPTDPGDTATNYTIVAINLTVNGSWTISAGDGTNVVQANTSISFFNKIHMGARIDGTIDDAFILGLAQNSLQATRATVFTVTAGASDKIYFASPTAYGDPTFLVGGFAGGFTKVASAITHTNASGHAENYDVWASNQYNLGLTEVTAQ